MRAYCGHGIGETFHTSLQIPHHYDPAVKRVMEPGMTFTIEPMITEGTWQDLLWNDGWTAVTADGKRSAQFEHTIAVGERGRRDASRSSSGPPARPTRAARPPA